MRPSVRPTGIERFFEEDEIIVSKTDPKGVITYANRVFLRIAQYEEEEILGAAHNIIRHPDMPQCIFDLLWKTIASGQEIFAYVKNMAKNGDHYWVFAHVTPTFDSAGTDYRVSFQPAGSGPERGGGGGRAVSTDPGRGAAARRLAGRHGRGDSNGGKHAEGRQDVV